MGTTGIVTAIDRTNHQCRVQALGSAAGAELSAPAKRPILYPKYRGDPPPPMSYVDLEQIQPAVWRIAGAGGIAEHRLVVREDWTLIVRDGAGTVWANEIWGESGGGVITINNTYGGIGVADLDSQAAGEVVTKGDQCIVTDASLGYWLSCSIGQDSGAAVANHVGFSDLAAANQAMVGFSSLVGAEILITTAASTVTTTTLPFVPPNFTFFTVDLVFVPGEYAACWIDGAGPYLSTSNIPAAGSMLQPYLATSTLNSLVPVHLYCDWVRVGAFRPVANPTRDLMLPSSGFVA